MPRLYLLLAFALTGCVNSQSISLTDAESRAYINDRAESGHPVLALHGKRGRQVHSLNVGPDVTTWVDKKTGESRSARTAHVEAVTYRRDGAGALKGAAIGIGIGVALGLFAGETDDGSGLINYGTFEYMGMFGGSGAAVGALGGAIHSDRAIFRVLPPLETSAIPSDGPCGGPPLACAVPSRFTGR